MKRQSTTIISVAFLLLASVSLGAATLPYDWSPSGDQGLQGWTNEKIDTDTFTDTYEFYDNGEQLGVSQETSGDDKIQDATHKTLVVQSPFFTLTGTTSIAFTLSQGLASVELVSDFDSLPENSSAPGYVGLALMRKSDGFYLLDQSKTSNGDDGESFSFSNPDITFATSGDSLTEQYALQLIDYKDDSWGHVGLISVTLTDVALIPEPSSLVLLLLLGAGLGAGSLARRLRR